MSDLIDRNDAVEAIEFEKVYMTAYKGSSNGYVSEGNPFKRYNKGLDDAIKAINGLTPAEPEQRWIPVSEALPEEREWLGTKRFGTTISDEVYVTFENPKGERFCKHLSFQNGRLSRYDQYTIDAFYPDAKPIAWMPLPEPYRGE